MRDAIEPEGVRGPGEISWQEHAAVINKIHHRVKNNLQIIVSLFNLQADRTTQPEAADVLRDMQNRVRAIANIHERLYSVEDFSVIHFGEYLTNLVRELERFHAFGARVQVQLSLADLALDIDDATALALISNELLSNAFRHAFPDGRRGRISIALQYGSSGTQEDESRLGELRIIDDGVGLPPNLDFSTAESMGFHLVRILTQQLEGKVEVQAEGGTAIRVSFPLAKEQ